MSRADTPPFLAVHVLGHELERNQLFVMIALGESLAFTTDRLMVCALTTAVMVIVAIWQRRHAPRLEPGRRRALTRRFSRRPPR